MFMSTDKLSNAVGGPHGSLSHSASNTLSTAQRIPPENGATCNVLAVTHVGHTKSTIDVSGTAIAHKVRGRAEVEFKDGRARITLDMGNLGDPQRLGALYTTFILWAVAPEDQADYAAS
jgi:hypothetical protein